MTPLWDFPAVLRATGHRQDRCILLGNGLSIPAAPALATQALAASVEQALPRFGVHPETIRHFANLDEPVENRMVSLKRCEDCLRYLANVRAALIEAILEGLPNGHSDLRISLCPLFSFLAHFATVFTLSYDLLLYWVIMHGPNCPECQDQHATIRFGDGFGKATLRDDGYHRSAWHDHVPSAFDRVYYLHGAMHLVAEGNSASKLKTSPVGTEGAWPPTLSELIRDRRHKGHLPPLFVCEATAEAKMEQIEQNAYLGCAKQRFDTSGGHFVLYGVGLNDQDDHLWRSISVNGGIKSLNVGVYGDPDSAENRGLINRACKIATDHGSLTLRFYRSETANAWGQKSQANQPEDMVDELSRYFQ